MSNLLDQNAKALDKALKQLSPDQKRYLEYFWNGRRREIRDRLPLEIIYFFEKEPHHGTLAELTESEVNVAMLDLVIKGYIKETGTGRDVVYLLAQPGVEYLKDRHPRLIVLWQRFLDTTPAPVSLTIGFIGFVASLFGIYEGVLKLFIGK
jgi:hypothetical protein